MSMIDSGMMFGSPLSPLRQSLIRGAMPNLMNPLMGAGGAPQPGPFTAAHQYGQARRRGSPTMGGPQAGAQAGPMNDSLLKASMIDAAGLDDDEKEKYKGLDVNGLREVLQLRQQRMAHRPKAKPNINLFDQPQQQAQATIGGPAPEGMAPGTIQILQGRHNGMDAGQLADFGRRVAAQTGGGEQFSRVTSPVAPGSANQEFRGFQVSNIPAPAQPQMAQGGPAQALQAAGVDPKFFPAIQQLVNGGASLEQAVNTVLTHQRAVQGAERSAQRQQELDKRETQREQHSDQRHQQDLVLRQLQHQQTLASQQGDDAQVQAIQQKIDGMMKPQAPQPQQPQQPAGQMPDISKLQPGQQVVINGHVYEKE